MSRLWPSLKQAAGRDDIPYPTHNPLTGEGKRVMESMGKTYGTKKGKKVFYSMINMGAKGSKKWHGK